METKICTKCKKELPATTEYFSKHYSCKFGVASQCKDCIKKYRENRKAISTEYFRKYNIEHKEKRKQQYMDNREHKLAIKKIWRNKTEVKLREKENQQNRYKNDKHKNIRLVLNQKYRSKAKDNFLDVNQWEELKLRFNNSCAYCGKSSKLTQDHIVPLSKGGTYTKNNIVPACGSCNPSKKNNDLFEWYRKQDFYSEARLQSILKIQKDI